MRTHLQHKVLGAIGCARPCALAITLAAGIVRSRRRAAASRPSQPVSTANRRPSRPNTPKSPATARDDLSARAFDRGAGRDFHAGQSLSGRHRPSRRRVLTARWHRPEGAGAVSAFRYGLLSEGKARVVIDTTGPVVIKRAIWRPRAATRSTVRRARADLGASVRQRYRQRPPCRRRRKRARSPGGPDRQKRPGQAADPHRCRAWRYRPGRHQRRQPQGEDGRAGRGAGSEGAASASGRYDVQMTRTPTFSFRSTSG